MSTLASTNPDPRAPHLWRLRRLFVLVLASLVVLVALFYAVENFRGSREWAHERARLAELGWNLDLDTLTPPPLPPESNFARIPLLASLFDYEANPDGAYAWRDTNGFQRAMSVFRYHPRWPSKGPSPAPHWQSGQATPLADWSRTFRELALDPQVATEASRNAHHVPLLRLPEPPGDAADDVLAALQSYDTEFRELALGIRNHPQARFDIRYEDDYAALLPHLALFKKSVGQFALRAAANLAKGRTNEAFEDTRTALLLAELPKSEPFLISQLVRLADLNLALQPVWEGAGHHLWSDTQLKELQEMLSRVDPLPEWRRAHQWELAVTARVTRRIATSSADRARYGALFIDMNRSGGFDLEPWFDVYLRVAPRGWLYASLAETSRRMVYLSQTTPATLPQLRQLGVPESSSAGEHPLRLLLHRAYWRMSQSLGESANQWTRAFRGQTHARLAVIALALERRFLRDREYPRNLESLMPDLLPSLPLDPMTDRPFRYERPTPTSFRLWSLGADGEDQQGAPAGEGEDRLVRGDWAWATP